MLSRIFNCAKKEAENQRMKDFYMCEAHASWKAHATVHLEECAH